jgi:6,7-dimethyl-8-ribityllumazine synthase
VTLFEGAVGAAGDRRFAVVVSRFNSAITDRLLAGCREALAEGGVEEAAIDVAWVPGAVEIPLVCRRLVASGGYAAVIALGCVIRGATSHYDFVCAMVSRGVLEAGLATLVPVIFGVLTTDNEAQALERAGSGYANKGYEAGLAALEMASLLPQLPNDHPDR